MGNTHFRIIELPDHQVLITKDFDNENEDSKPIVSVSFFLEGLKITQSLGFDNEVVRDRVFTEFKDEAAQGIVDSIMKLVSN